MYEKFGAHLMTEDGTEGVYFAVWAPNAKMVSVVGAFNEWNAAQNKLMPAVDGSGIWDGFIPGIKEGMLYKFHIQSNTDKYTANKGRPLCVLLGSAAAHRADQSGTSITSGRMRPGPPGYEKAKMRFQAQFRFMRSILDRGAGKNDKENSPYNYREIAPLLAEYIKEQGFTHVEFLPLMEHPFYGSWGYQTTGYFAPTSRYGTPQDLMYLIDYLHQQDIGVLLDWVPSHFPSDEHGLAYYDGTHLYEHADPREGFHPDWKSYIFNYGRNEVRSFLFSSAMFWLRQIPYRRPARRCRGIDALPRLLPRPRDSGSPTNSAAAKTSKRSRF